MSARVQRTSPCGKVRFRNRNAAMGARDTWAQVARRTGAPPPLFRLYRCPDCRGWHLTRDASRFALNR